MPSTVVRVGGRRWTGRDLLILAFLTLFAIQCVRSDFFVNDAWTIDWRRFAHGDANMPYQGRVGMMPVLRWAEQSPWMVSTAARYDGMTNVGPQRHETVTVEKFTSLLAGLAATLLLLAYIVRYGRRRFALWWLPALWMLSILAVSLAVRSEHNIWTTYDLPHACLFGIAVMCAFEGQWVSMLLLFAIDVPVRETSIFLLAVSCPMSWITWRQRRFGQAAAAGMAALMGVYWLAWRTFEQRRFAHNTSDTGRYLPNNVHELLYPQHWPQMLCVGGYLIFFVILEQRRLSDRARWLLYGTLLCVPVTLVFGIWGETRIWLEWTLPWAVLGAMECEDWIRCSQRPGVAAGEAVQ